MSNLQADRIREAVFDAYEKHFEVIHQKIDKWGCGCGYVPPEKGSVTLDLLAQHISGAIADAACSVLKS